MGAAMKAFGNRRSNADRHIVPNEVVAFWRASSDRWFEKDAAFDAAFRDGFLDLHMAVAARRYDDWMETPQDTLALLILTDQFPRNAFRGTAHMFATDPLAHYYARLSLDAGHMARVEPDLRLFFCLPFAHSEDLADQELSMRLNAGLGQPWLEHAKGHRDIIRRFGRFPHRNPVLGRTTTPEEDVYLKGGGFQG